MTGKPPSPRQRAYFLLGYRRGKSRRHSEELREMQDRFDDWVSEQEVGSEAADDDDADRD